MEIFVLGGFCGRPTALHLSKLGHEAVLVDVLSRRTVDDGLEAASLTPVSPVSTRPAAWREVSGRDHPLVVTDVARRYAGRADGGEPCTSAWTREQKAGGARELGAL